MALYETERNADTARLVRYRAALRREIDERERADAILADAEDSRFLNRLRKILALTREIESD